MLLAGLVYMHRRAKRGWKSIPSFAQSARGLDQDGLPATRALPLAHPCFFRIYRSLVIMQRCTAWYRLPL